MRRKKPSQPNPPASCTGRHGCRPRQAPDAREHPGAVPAARCATANVAGQGCGVVIFWWLWAHKWISSEGAVSALSGAAAPGAAAAAEASSTCVSRLSCTRGPAKGRPVRGAACELVAFVVSSYKISCQHVVHAVHSFPRTRSSRGRPQISSQPAEINNSTQNSTCCRPKPDEVVFSRRRANLSKKSCMKFCPGQAGFRSNVFY